MDEWLTIMEVARMLDISRQRIAQWVDDGTIKGAQKAGHFWLVPRSEAERLALERPLRKTGRPRKQDRAPPPP